LFVEGTSPAGLDYHLIHPTNDANRPYFVISQIGVPEGSFVYFYPLEIFRSQGELISLKINDIQSVNSISAGFFEPHNVVIDVNEKTLFMDILTFSHFGITLRVKANNTAGFRHYYFPEAIQGDTLTIEWNDLVAETNLKQISLPGNPYIFSIQIDAVSPDFKNAISIVRSFSSAIPTYSLPEFIPTDWLLGVNVNTNSFFVDRLFGFQEPIAFSTPDLSIDSLGCLPKGSHSICCLFLSSRSCYLGTSSGIGFTRTKPGIL